MAVEHAETTGYEVEGTARFRMFLPGGERSGIPLNFTLSVRDCVWSLTITRGETNGLDHEQVTFDGQSQFYLASMKTAVERAKADGKKVAANVANAFIGYGELYHGQQATEVGSIWLAYASGCFFSNLTTNFMEPPLSFDGTGRFYDRPDHMRKLRIQHQMMGNSFVQFPSSVVFFDDGSTALGSRQPAPYDRGFTNCLYSVDAWTNFSGTLIPAVATLKLFTPRLGGRSETELTLLGEYQIEILKFRFAKADFANTPNLPGVTLVFDSRLPEFPDLIYPTTNRWPSVEEIRLHPEFRKALTGFQSKPRKERLVRAVIITAFILSLCFPILWLWRFRKKPVNER
jgi:hypothetical protein